MRRNILCALSLGVFTLAGCADQPSPASPDSPDLAMSSNAPIYLVTFRSDVSDVRGTALELSRAKGFAIRFLREHAARGFSAVMPDRLAQEIRNDPRVAIVERDGPVSLIQPLVGAAARPGAPQVVSYGTTRVGGSGDGTGKTAWIIDTGIDLDHPDLNTSRNCHTFFTGRSPDDQNGHGTHVSGIVAAKNNSIGTLGVAANAFVCSVRVLGPSGSGTFEGVTNGVNYVAANGAPGDVANMSLGGTGSNATLEQAVKDAAAGGISFTLAAGNSSENANNFTPARANGPNIYTISAIGSNDCFASFSNFGNPPVDFAAPGVSIISTYKGGGTKTLSGTSMAAPHVAGILLLGPVQTNGTACNDPDGNPDPIAHR